MSNFAEECSEKYLDFTIPFHKYYMVYQKHTMKKKLIVEIIMTIEELIGPHPKSPHAYGDWWSFVDMPATVSKKHRALDEISGMRDKALDQMAQWIVDYHLTNVQNRNLDKQRAILDRNELSSYVDKMNVLPVNECTKKGNLGEITLIEYLKESRGFDPLVYKFHYNSNFNQSMKGDDCLLFNREDLESEVIYGECKFRSKPSKKVITDIVDNLQGAKGLPSSITFVANCLDQRGEIELADRLLDLHLKIMNGKIPLTNVGFLISTKSVVPSEDTKSTIEKHLSTTNSRMVMVSLGVNNPIQIVDEAYNRAVAILRSK